MCTSIYVRLFKVVFVIFAQYKIITIKIDGCAAQFCNNSPEKEYTMKLFPTNPERRILWIKKSEYAHLTKLIKCTLINQIKNNVINLVPNLFSTLKLIILVFNFLYIINNHVIKIII